MFPLFIMIHYQVKELDRSIQKREELKKEVCPLEFELKEVVHMLFTMSWLLKSCIQLDIWW